MFDRIVQVLQSEPHIIAAWLAGSRGRGTADCLSDIDIWLAVEDDAIGTISADPLAFVHAIAPTIMRISAPSIALPGGVFLLTWMQAGAEFEQVDWYWVPTSTAPCPSQTKLLFERQSMPVVNPPVPARLDVGSLVADIDGAITDSLLLIAYARKATRRDDPWLAVKHIQHANDCLAKLDWLVAHGRVPEFHDQKRSSLADAIPTDRNAVQTALCSTQDDLASLVESAGRERRCREAWPSNRWCCLADCLRRNGVR